MNADLPLRVRDARRAYAALRASCSRHSARRFNELARQIAHELSDGEEVLPVHFLSAARMLVAGFDNA